MTPRRKIEAALDAMAPEIRAAFLACIEDIKSAAQLNLIAGHLEQGNVDAAIVAMNIRPEFFGPLDRALDAAYYRGGVAAIAALPSIPDPFPASASRSASTDAMREPNSTSGTTPRP